MIDVTGLSDADKAALVNGRDTWSTVPFPEIGLGSIRMSDGPAGVRGTMWDERRTAVSFPCGAAMGATFDVGLLHEVGRALAAEARAQGVHVVLGPTINLQRFAHAGRHFEYLAADPYLSAELAVAYVRGLQSAGVAATPKHFVANDCESERHTVDVRMNDRVLRETYLLPFEAVVRDAGTWALMAAYSSIDGVPMTANRRLLDAIAIDEWGFDGVTMSDWGAVYSTEPSVRAGLHLAMPGPGGPWGEPLRVALAEGRVTGQELDDKVARIARLAHRTGAVDAVEPPGVEHVDARAVARRAAEASVVMLRNDGLLPLDPRSVRRVAVIGPNAVQAYTQGGGSAFVNAGPLVGPAAAIADRLGTEVEVVVGRGCEHRRRVPALGVDMPALDPATHEPGVGLAYVDHDGRILHRETRATGRLVWYGDLPDGVVAADVALVRIEAAVPIVVAGEYEIGVDGMTSQRLLVDGEVVLDVDRSDDDPERFHRPDEHRVRIDADRGQVVSLVVEQPLESSRGLSHAQVGVRPLVPTDDDLLAEAVRLAADADVAVVVAGTNAEVECEGFDRPSLVLPGRQEELIRRVCDANPRTVVVVNAGAPVAIEWRDAPAAILVSWFGGQWTGPAIAGALVGDVEPTGRLPMPWPASDAGVERPAPRDGALDYGDDPWLPLDGPAYAYPFGAGRGYARWRWDAARVAPVDTPATPPPTGCRLGDPRAVPVDVRLVNDGPLPGTEVVQVYATRSGTDRRLVGFGKAQALPGEAVTCRVEVPARMLMRWEPTSSSWVGDESISALVVAGDARDPGLVLPPESYAAVFADPSSAPAPDTPERGDLP
jgi:beta-glucosidase